MIGIGIDAVDIERLRRALDRRPGLARRLFSDSERNDLAGRGDQVPGLAARLAAKEATWKALGVGLGATGLREVEVVRLPSGAPQLRLSGAADRLATDRGVTAWHVSLTHTRTLAGAVVVAQ